MTPTRILLVATTRGYQTRMFGEAAERLGVELVFATDRCAVIDDPWRDAAIPVRFHEPGWSVARVSEAARRAPVHGVLAVGDRPAVLAAHLARALGLPGHSPEAAAAARDKLQTKHRLQQGGLRVTPYLVRPLAIEPDRLAAEIAAGRPETGAVAFPVVIKPLALSASRGVMRADTPVQLARALHRLRAILTRPDVRAERDEVHDWVLVESFIDGHEFAVEGLMHAGAFHALAVFDKPDPLDGPFFEETIYVTPPAAGAGVTSAITRAVGDAAAAIGLSHGPVHAECRVNSHGVFVLEAAARPIGGLCAKALRFTEPGTGRLVGLEELLLRHARGELVHDWLREPEASGVMMIPVPRRGVFRRVDGVDAARDVDGVSEVDITAKPDQRLVPLPEGASYPGFIFARHATSGGVERALREAHRRLAFAIEPEVPVVQSPNG